MKHFVALIAGAMLLSAAPASAQLASPNAEGVAFGHVHVFGRDIEALRRFFTILGGEPTQNGPLQMMRFPGAFVNMGQRDTSAGGSVGSVVNHFGFHVKSVPELTKRLSEAGYMVQQLNPAQAFVMGPMKSASSCSKTRR